MHNGPPHILGGAVNLAGLRPAAPPARPVTDEQSGETMRISANSPDVFDGAAPQVGDSVEFVCVRADARGWGLRLRVKSAKSE